MNKKKRNLWDIPDSELTTEQRIEKLMEDMIANPEFKDDCLERMFNAYYDGEQYENAIRAIGQAIQCATEPHPDYYGCLSMAYKKLGDLPNAITAKQKQIELSPFEPYNYFEMGRLYVETGDFTKAVENFVSMLAFPLKFGQLTSADWFFECMSSFYTENYDNEFEDEMDPEALNTFQMLLKAATTKTQQAYMHCVLSRFYLYYEKETEAQKEAKKAYRLLPDEIRRSGFTAPPP